jgi:hypothetical protein
MGATGTEDKGAYLDGSGPVRARWWLPILRRHPHRIQRCPGPHMPPQLASRKPGGAAPPGDVVQLRDGGSRHPAGLKLGGDVRCEPLYSDLLKVDYAHG